MDLQAQAEEAELCHRVGQLSNEAPHQTTRPRSATAIWEHLYHSRRAEAMRAASRPGGAMKVGTATGVVATNSAGVISRPSIVPNRQPASATITAPAATSWVASPRKVHA